MAWLGIVGAPFFGLAFLAIRFFALLGKETWFFRLLSKRAVRDARERMSRAFRGYEPTEKDVFVCSFPKSGTNWGMQIAYQIAHLGQGEYEHIHDVVAWPDATRDGLAVPLQHPMANESPTGFRVIKTHCSAADVPYSPQAKYICIVRDPKDAYVSAYHFIKDVEFGYLMPSVHTWVDMATSEAGMDWAGFTGGYWAWRERPNVLFLTFEEMKADLPSAVRRIAALMGIDPSPELFERICYLSGYAHMKGIDHKFYPGKIAPLGSPKGSMIRSGKKGESASFFTPEQRSRIDDYARTQLQARGSDFPYEAHYCRTKEPNR